MPDPNSSNANPSNIEAVLNAVLGKLRTVAETSQTFGKPITVGETTIVPYISLRFGLGGGGGGSSLAGSDLDRPQGDGGSGAWGGAGGGVRVEPMGFLVIRGDKVELLPIDGQPHPWTQLAEGLLPVLEEWIRSRTDPSSELE
jgi:uncharacterized spore protein YtfJ